MPTRIVDVAAVDATGTVRLCTTNGQTGQYLALSHRWGPSTLNSSTVKSTLASCKSAIRLGTLSRTMRDAINLTRRLGLQYIWIDSLCIIQDDPEDWKREAKSMASVYEKALLTLAATAADDRAGLFAQSNLHDLATLPHNAQDPRSPPVYFTAHTAQPHGWDRHILNAPLNSRAWVMQERLLSRRIVHFACDQLCWECRLQRSSQTGITYADNTSSAFSMIQRQSPANADRYLIANADVHSFITNMQELLSKHGTKISSDRSLRGAFGHLWMTLIEAYAHCNLTGLAVRLQAAAGISHIYGHWFHGLVPLMPLLLWYAPGHAAWKKDDGARPNGGGLTRPRRQRCPTWSWASMDGGVSFLTRFEYESFATLVAVETAARDGLDVHASLIFRGCVFKARRVDARNQSADGEHWN